MVIETKRKPKESPQSLIRRFSQSVQRSGVLIRARKNRFQTKEKSEQLKKRAALRREEVRAVYEKKKKFGNDFKRKN
jgi:hypothetical protein